MGTLRANPGGDSAEFGREREPKCPVHATPVATNGCSHSTSPHPHCPASLLRFPIFICFEHFYDGHFNTLSEDPGICVILTLSLSIVFFHFSLGFPGSWFDE